MNDLDARPWAEARIELTQALERAHSRIAVPEPGKGMGDAAKAPRVVFQAPAARRTYECEQRPDLLETPASVVDGLRGVRFRGGQCLRRRPELFPRQASDAVIE